MLFRISPGIAPLLLVATCCAGEPDFKQILAESGLVYPENGNRWLLPEEKQLRQRLAELDGLWASIAATETYLSERIAANRRQWPAQQQEIARWQKELSRHSPADPQHVAIRQRIALLESAVVSPDKLGGLPEVRGRLIDLTSRRHQLLCSVYFIRQTAAELPGRYAALQENSEVAAALKRLEARLGPISTYAAELRKIRKYESAVYQAVIPIYLQGEFVRVGCLLNETTPVTFTWSAGEEPALLTTGMAEAAGLPQDGEAVRIQLEGRTFQARRTTLGYLRLGKHVLREVEALILPPEAEDLGGRLGPAAFGEGVTVYAAPEELRLVVEEGK